VSKMDGTGLPFWTSYYSGNSNVALGYGIATDDARSVYIAGYTNASGGHATPGAHQTTPGGVDAVIAKFIDCSGTVLNLSANTTDACFGQGNGTITVSASGTNAPNYRYRIGTTGAYQASNLFANMAKGNYTINIIDTVGCKGSTTATVGEAAAITAAITGTATPQAFKNETYAAPSIAGMLYNWSVTNSGINAGQGTNQVTVGWGAQGTGEVKVVMENAA
jgi:hypothetical protein